MNKDYDALGLTLLGSTGSIGIQTLSVASSIGARIDMMSAGSNDKLFEEQCRRFMPKRAAMADPEAAKRLKTALSDTEIKIYSGDEGVAEAAFETKTDAAVVAVSGMAAAKPMMAAAQSTNRICMANKEAIVAAGHHLLRAIKDGGAELIPVDSEHSAIFQCLRGGERRDVRKILLTASGGPFFGRKREELEKITPKDALAHPTWLMGKKITIDSATLMNKGFELIEAMRLFDVSADDVEVVIHRESIVHSMVEYRDGAIIAQLGLPDMRTAISYALTYPRRHEGEVGSVDFKTLSKLTFGVPDTEAFPCLALARDSAKKGGTYPAVMSASDEIAVDAFLHGKLGFCEIHEVVATVTEKLGHGGDVSLEDVFIADREAREVTRDILSAR